MSNQILDDDPTVRSDYELEQDRKAHAERQALADVRTLDEWAAQDPDVRYWVNAFANDGQPDCRLLLSAFSLAGYGKGPTPDAARRAAAAWVRGQTGEQPAAAAKLPLTDAHRIEVVREIVEFEYRTGGSMFEYERQAKERMGR